MWCCGHVRTDTRPATSIPFSPSQVFVLSSFATRLPTFRPLRIVHNTQKQPTPPHPQKVPDSKGSANPDYPNLTQLLRTLRTLPSIGKTISTGQYQNDNISPIEAQAQQYPISRLIFGGFSKGRYWLRRDVFMNTQHE